MIRDLTYFRGVYTEKIDTPESFIVLFFLPKKISAVGA